MRLLLNVPQYAAVLNHRSLLARCAVPSSTAVTICVAVRYGKVVGTTVTSSPPDAEMADCMADVVRALSFPYDERMGTASISFSAL